MSKQVKRPVSEESRETREGTLKEEIIQHKKYDRYDIAIKKNSLQTELPIAKAGNEEHTIRKRSNHYERSDPEERGRVENLCAREYFQKSSRS